MDSKHVWQASTAAIQLQLCKSHRPIPIPQLVLTPQALCILQLEPAKFLLTDLRLHWLGYLYKFCMYCIVVTVALTRLPAAGERGAGCFREARLSPILVRYSYSTVHVREERDRTPMYGCNAVTRPRRSQKQAAKTLARFTRIRVVQLRDFMDRATC